MDSSKIIQPVVACIGFPVAGNPTQFVMEKSIAQLGMDWRFVTFQVEPAKFEQAVTGIHAMGFAGAFFLPPFERDAAGFCDQLAPAAAVSKIVRIAKKHDLAWIGDDTLAAAIVALLPANTLAETEASAVLCLGDPSIAEVLRSIEPRLLNRVFESLPEREHTTAATLPSENVESVPKGLDAEVYSAIILGKSSMPFNPKKMAALPINDNARLILMKENKSMDDWLDFAQRRSMSIVQSIDLSVRQYMESLHFLTGLRGNELLIREALEEYLNW